MSDLVGHAIAGYPLQKLLNRGAYEEVYQAASSAAPVALRVLRANLRQEQELNAAVAKGWEAARAVAHPGLVTVYSTGLESGVGAYSLEEPTPGKPLRQMVIGGSKVAWRDCLVLAEQLFLALQALHGARVCHGCLWSGCVLITQDQDLKLESAGGLSLVERPLAAIVAGPATGYLAPEILGGSPASPEGDIYGAGACLYLVLAGQDPYPGEDKDKLAKQVLERPPVPLAALREDVTPEATAFISRLLAKDPVQRYGTANGVLADIGRLKSGLALLPLQGGRAPAPPRTAGVSPAPAGGTPAVPGASVSPAPPTSHTLGLPGSPKAKGTRVIFGGLDTHVKSTIPRSDIEKRGDDCYRQGQLAQALAAWKDAQLNATSHPALEVKIELADKALKAENRRLALEEARYRLSRRDFKGAVSRAREAMQAAGNKAEHEEAVEIERDALALQWEAARKRSLVKIVAAAAGVAALALLVWWLSRATREGTGTAPEDDKAGTLGTPAKPESPGKAAQPKAEAKLVAGAATVTLPSSWTVGAGVAQLLQQGEAAGAATLKITQCPKGTTRTARQEELRKAPGVTKADKKDDWENFGAFIDGVYVCSELGFQYSAGDKLRFRYYYIVDGPDGAYLAEFDGRGDVLTPALQAQMRQIMQSLTYKK
ncbi:MAG: protein kinase [Planctomycetota bacterium]